jgi:hypothetical protein
MLGSITFPENPVEFGAGKKVDSEKDGKHLLSEVGFKPTPSEEDCDLNAAP